ncbi:VOC family protein [Solihabitans fulvus]|uniref:VOC family protein n=1 Tax=Solihabitans fulvus TaxID=1892852 RepID=A0A5B2WSY9_9PSEU|nr:VOC family protein [Solihabitans fulvus]KAA2254841.1 VOC family protein [Solihabitans fulvus]
MLTSTNAPGGPAWLDLAATDIATTAAFYTNLFGWSFKSFSPEPNSYGVFLLDGKTVAAIGPHTEESTTPSWTIYFHTADADATAKAVSAAGGTVRFEPMDVSPSGRMAGFTDPAGGQFAVWQGGEIPGLETYNVPGSMSWLELYSTDADAAKSFYRTVFEWDTVDMPAGPDMTYTIASPKGGGQTTMHGGMMQLGEANLAAGSTSEWHPYFEVADCDAAYAKALELGATELIAPMDTPMAGRTAMVTDPFGAPFALITSLPV